MFTQILETMEQQSAAVLAEQENARALWFNEWAKFMRQAYHPGRAVIYTSFYAFPVELLAAFDVALFDFEIAGAMIGTTPLGVPTMLEAESRGCSMDMCSFHRLALGAFFQDYFPRPDLLLTTSYYCDQKGKANDIAARLCGAEPLLLDTPSSITTESVRYVESQLRHIAARVGEVAGQRLDEDRLKECIRSANRARRSHLKMLELLRHRPAPWGGSTLIGFSINSLMFTGRPEKERLNDAFIQHMEARMAGADLRPERHRVLWFAWLPAYPSNIFDTLKAHDVSIPMCETMRLYWDEIDEDSPFEGLALKCLKNPFVGPQNRRTEWAVEAVETYATDGAILFATPACRHSKSGYRLLQDALGRVGVPLLTLDVDISDPRGYSPEQIKTRLEGFIELLDQRG